MVTNRKADANRSHDLFGYPSGTTLMTGPAFTDPVLVREFILAGRAKVTIKSEKTGKHYTYRVNRISDSAVHGVAAMVAGPPPWLYLGAIFLDEGSIFRPTRKTCNYARYHPAYRAFNWFWEILVEKERMPQGVTVFHEGKCGMCGRELTDPVSVTEGYGPDCRKKRLRHGFMYDRRTA